MNKPHGMLVTAQALIAADRHRQAAREAKRRSELRSEGHPGVSHDFSHGWVFPESGGTPKMDDLFHGKSIYK